MCYNIYIYIYIYTHNHIRTYIYIYVYICINIYKICGSIHPYIKRERERERERMVKYNWFWYFNNDTYATVLTVLYSDIEKLERFVILSYHFILFNWNHFAMRLLNLRINFYLLRTFCPLSSDNGFIRPENPTIHYHPSGLVAQRIDALSLYGSRWALSEDSGFKSYPSRPEVYLVKNVVRQTTIWTIQIVWRIKNTFLNLCTCMQKKES